MSVKREQMQCDVLIIGAGPAGLAAAIRLKQLNNQLNIVVLEKAARVGGQIVSGAILQPDTLNALLPYWQHQQPPTHTPVTQDSFYYLTETHAKRLPKLAGMNNHGNTIISLSQFCQWLGKQAENLGINIFPGFVGSVLLYDDKQQVIGVQTDDRGLDFYAKPTDNFQPGIEIYAKHTLLAEGCRGYLSEQVIKKYQLRGHCDPQSYGLGIKEVWKIGTNKHQSGNVMHSVGWPLDHATYGGGFIYHYGDNLVSVGLVVGLDYKNPYLDPFEEMQRFKLHPQFRYLFEESECIAYGARALNEGGYQSIPKLNFPGGLLIGCAAGFVNVAKIKGIHNAMRSGMLAAECIVANETEQYDQRIRQSVIGKELKKVRNVRPGFHKGLWPGLMNAAVDQILLQGKAPWTLRYKKQDYQMTQLAKQFQPIHYPKPDGKITFDKLTQLSLCAISYNEKQRWHLVQKDRSRMITINYEQYASPETHYCPAAVYEIVQRDGQPKLQINGANCIHCKTCDIKDPTQNIAWTPEEGGDGPSYSET